MTKLKLLAGRNYSLENGPDENKDHIILNESDAAAISEQSELQLVAVEPAEVMLFDLN